MAAAAFAFAAARPFALAHLSSGSSADPCSCGFCCFWLAAAAPLLSLLLLLFVWLAHLSRLPAVRLFIAAAASFSAVLRLLLSLLLLLFALASILCWLAARLVLAELFAVIFGLCCGSCFRCCFCLCLADLAGSCFRVSLLLPLSPSLALLLLLCSWPLAAARPLLWLACGFSSLLLRLLASAFSFASSFCLVLTLAPAFACSASPCCSLRLLGSFSF